MTRKRNKLGILTCSALLVIGVLLIAGCAGSQAPTENSTTKHYGVKGIAFDYPATWVIQSSSSRFSITVITDPQAERTNVFFDKRTMPSGSTLEQIHDGLVSEGVPTEIISDSTLTVAGLPAFETVFKSEQGIPSREYETMLLSLEKDGWVYTITCSAPAELFDAARPTFDMIINSFQIT
jgi:hypothetical protein